MIFRRLLTAATTFVLIAAPALAMQPPAGQSGFVPARDLPPTEQLQAAPLLVSAYAFVWLAVMVYVWTILRRLTRVETEMRSLAQKTRG